MIPLYLHSLLNGNMSKVEAYICDYCQQLRIADECVGVAAQEDLFDKLASFPTNPRPEKESIHYCTNCYTHYVISPAEREVNRKKDEHGYMIKINELAYLLRSQTVNNFNKKNMRKHLRK